MMGPPPRAWLLGIPIAVFLCATLANLRLPGVQYDELYYVPPAAALLKGQHDMDFVQLEPSVIQIAGRPFPLMFNYYTSFLRTYLTLPAFALFGINVATVRGSSVAFAAVALLFFMLFTRRLTGRTDIAVVTGLFLALDASFVAYTHNDYVAVSTMMAWKALGLWALIRWWQEGGLRWLCTAGFVMGLGITDRVSFLWILISLGAMLFLLGRTRTWSVLRKRVPRLRDAALAIALGAVGASLFIAFNLATGGGSFSPMAETFRQTSGGVDNLDFLGNLHLRLMMLTDLLGGEYLPHFILGENTYVTTEWNFSGSPLSWLMPLAFVFFSSQAALNALKRRPANRVGLFLLGMIAFILVLSCFTPTIHRGHQLLILYPFPHILVVLFLYECLQWVRKTRQSFVRHSSKAAAIVVGILLAMASKEAVDYHAMLEESGGRGVWSDAVFEIVAEADRRADKTFVCLDWGFNANLLSLTKNRVRTIRNYETTRRTPEGLAQLFTKEHLFVLHAEGSTYVQGARDDFLRAVREAAAEVDTVRVFHHRAGDPVAYFLSVRR